MIGDSSRNAISPPNRIYLDVTNVCQLKCLHCYSNSANNKNIDAGLNLLQLSILLDQIQRFRISHLIISGGEPFTRSDIFDFLALCSRADLSTTVVSNAVLIDHAMARKLKNLDIRLRISFDGVSEETHDYVRGKGNFKDVLNVIKILKSEGFEKLSVHFTVNRRNISEILEIPKLLCHIDVKDIVISTIKPIGRAVHHPELLIGPELVLWVKDKINTIKRNKLVFFNTYSDKNWGGLACPAAYAKCGITATGKITPCVFLGKEYVGDSFISSTIEKLWNHDIKINKMRNLMANKDCLECPTFDVCNGGCRARALYYNGHIDKPDPYCCEIKKEAYCFNA